MPLKSGEKKRFFDAQSEDKFPLNDLTQCYLLFKEEKNETKKSSLAWKQ